MLRCFRDFLKKHDVEYIESFDMSRISYIGIGGIASLAVKPNDTDELVEIISFLNKNGIAYKVAGEMSNILPSDECYDGALVLTRKINKYNVAENVLTVDCGAKLSKILREISELDLGGMEELYGIPGSVGGMVYGNAGAYGKSMSDFLISASVYFPQEKKIIFMTNEEMKFSYRNSAIKNTEGVLLSARFSLIELPKDEIKKKLRDIIDMRKSTQPYGEKSLGSIFMRCPQIPTSLMIDRLGLKGLRVGGAEISKKHAGFIVNVGNATSNDVKTLISVIKEKIHTSYGIIPKEEIEFFN